MTKPSQDRPSFLDPPTADERLYGASIERLCALDAWCSERVDTYYVTSTGLSGAVATDGCGVELPGVTIYWDDQDPSAVGWCYRAARYFDLDTFMWAEVEEGELSEEGELARLIERARAIVLCITDAGRINQLGYEAGVAGDLDQVELCDKALGRDADDVYSRNGDVDAMVACLRALEDAEASNTDEVER